MKKIAIGLFILMIAAGCNAASNGSQQQSASTAAKPAPSPAAAKTPAPSPSPTSSGSVINYGHKSLTYGDAINKYNLRIQFVQCHGNPGTLNVGRGGIFMLDNRDGQARTIAFKGFSYRLPAYGFTLVSTTIRGNYPITCDGGGSAFLNVS